MMQANCYIICAGPPESCVIIDPGAEAKRIKRQLEEESLSPVAIILTHAHIDHIGASQDFKVPIFIHEEDKEGLIDPAKNFSRVMCFPFSLSGNHIETIQDVQVLDFDGLSLEVIHTPGHTPGSISLFVKSFPWQGKRSHILFSGDTLFASGVGRTDLPGSSERQLRDSLRNRILSLPGETVVFPGHGPLTTLEEEKRENPFLSDLL
jgi:glyoxylase-like metal-dependent hydrolase (beta-lactamase superfamily II)